jgi:hypothetical protein
MNSISGITTNTPLAGLQRAQSRLEQAASVIADPRVGSSPQSLASAAVDMKSAGIAAAANIKSIKAANETLGTLIDIMA